MKEKKISLMLSLIANQLLGPKASYRLKYYHNRGHFPNLRSPQDASEYLIAKLFSPQQCEPLAKFVDKVRVRDYIKNKGLESILLKHYGVWNEPEEIDFNILPEHFILKSNNGCGNHVICRDKSKLDIPKTILALHKAIDDGLNSPEPHYRYIAPLVFAEELIETETDDLPVDYKFTCSRGDILDVFVATERSTNTKYCTLDLNWDILPYTKPEFLPNQLPPRPKNLEKLADVARILSKDFDFVRVDLYEYKEQPYFSELTFFPWGALLYSYTDDAIKLYGELIRQVKINL